MKPSRVQQIQNNFLSDGALSLSAAPLASNGGALRVSAAPPKITRRAIQCNRSLALCTARAENGRKLAVCMPLFWGKITQHPSVETTGMHPCEKKHTASTNPNTQSIRTACYSTIVLPIYSVVPSVVAAVDVLFSSHRYDQIILGVVFFDFINKTKS